MRKLNTVNLSRTEWEKLIDEYILGRNSETRRKVLKRRLLDGLTFEQLASEFCYSTQNIQRIVYKDTALLFKKIK